MKKLLLALCLVFAPAATPAVPVDDEKPCPNPPFALDETCNNNPYTTPHPLNAPYGPIACPVGQSVDWTCVAVAELTYRASVSAAYTAAYVAYLTACQDYHATAGTLLHTFTTCYDAAVAAGDLDAAAECLTTYLDDLNQAKCRANTVTTSIQATFDSAVAAATAAYWAAVANCCDEN